MNCASFDRLAMDLAEERLDTRALREEALAHAAGCARCAGRLDQERALSADLRALALATEASEAPERIGEELLEAFRRRPTGPAPVAASGRPKRQLLWGAAAAMLLAGTLVAVRESRRGAPAQPPSPPAKTVVAEAVPPAAPSVPAAKPATRAVARRAGAPVPAQRAVVAETERLEVDEDEAAEFVPLEAGDALGDVESVQLVRVQLSPSTLTALGWAVGDESASRRVNADLVVGQDGVARAIRFVQ